MCQTIDEAIQVLGKFVGNGFTPLKFRWRHDLYRVVDITFVTELRDGSVRQRMYSVLAVAERRQQQLYRLLYDRDRERWLLHEVWCE